MVPLVRQDTDPDLKADSHCLLAGLLDDVRHRITANSPVLFAAFRPLLFAVRLDVLLHDLS